MKLTIESDLRYELEVFLSTLKEKYEIFSVSETQENSENLIYFIDMEYKDVVDTCKASSNNISVFGHKNYMDLFDKISSEIDLNLKEKNKNMICLEFDENHRNELREMKVQYNLHPLEYFVLEIYYKKFFEVAKEFFHEKNNNKIKKILFDRIEMEFYQNVIQNKTI